MNRTRGYSPVDPSGQLALAFPSDPAGEPGAAGHPSDHPPLPQRPPKPDRSRRELRPAAPARQVRVHERAMEPDAQAALVASAVGLFLPPGKTLDVTLTDNRYSMIAVSRKPDGYRLRVHRMFVNAEARIVRALARYVVHNDRRASGLLGDFIEQHQNVIRQQVRRPRRVRIQTAGRHHDLRAIFDRLNAERFGGALDARITWGAAPLRRQRRRSIKMGSYAVDDRIIRIHPALDQAHVPDYFVAWIVFHEMLHGKHDIQRENGRRRFHPPAFLTEERSFEDYERAHAWEKANLDKLLRV